jgi:hypothetical protein
MFQPYLANLKDEELSNKYSCDVCIVCFVYIINT